MSKSGIPKQRSQWNAKRFLSTLGYFGEVPFLGSFRWLQQLAGQSPVLSGITMTATKKIAIFNDGTLSAELLAALKIRLNDAIELVVIQPNISFSELNQLVRSVDETIVLNFQAFKAFVSQLKASELESAKLEIANVDSAWRSLFSNAEQIEQTVFNFADAACDLSAWGALDDVVMGGVSEGGLFLRRLEGGGAQHPDAENPNSQEVLPDGAVTRHTASRCAVFAGNVSTDNSGGFSSVRTKNFEPPFDFSGWVGIRLRVNGDGQRYKFILRNSGGWDSPAYIYSVDTIANEWRDRYVPFEEMVPTFRAKSVPEAPKLDPQKVFSFQLMLSKFEYDKRLNPSFAPGPFELKIADICLYRPRKGIPLIVIGANEAETRRQQQAELKEASIDHRIIAIDATTSDTQTYAAAIVRALE